MGDVIPIERNLPHEVRYEACGACGYRFVAVCPVECPTHGQECPKCHEFAVVSFGPLEQVPTVVNAPKPSG